MRTTKELQALAILPELPRGEQWILHQSRMSSLTQEEFAQLVRARAITDTLVFKSNLGCLTDDCEKWLDDTCKAGVPCMINRRLEPR